MRLSIALWGSSSAMIANGHLLLLVSRSHQVQKLHPGGKRMGYRGLAFQAV